MAVLPCRGHKTVVFILDEFDLFAKPFKQTVLYNLLDALQTSSVQVRRIHWLTQSIGSSDATAMT